MPAAVAALAREDVDLVRVYLRNIGKRKLLKAKEEQDIGRRIEIARSELLSALGTLPCAVENVPEPSAISCARARRRPLN